MTYLQPEIRDLALIGDRRTAAIVTTNGSIVWYCPGRFDHPSLFAALLDRQQGGAWTVELPGAHPEGRNYIEDSAVLETHFKLHHGDFTITDWMPMREDCPRGICRLFSPAPQAVVISLRPAPDYAQSAVKLHRANEGVRINEDQWLYASHALRMEGEAIVLHVPAGEEAWALLADAPMRQPGRADVERWLKVTLASWRNIASRITYHGPFEREVAQSLRALRLLTYEANGGIIAAATTSLPEVLGKGRNYDYRYVWLRDAGMITSALVRAGSNGPDEQRFLEFICGSRQEKPDEPLLPPFLSLDFKPAPSERHLELSGYRDSLPVRLGNNANDQLQMDGFANVLLAAKLIYGRHDTREHWDTVKRIADFLSEHWHEPDYGIWEEHEARHYTTGKVAASCGLRYIADFAENASQAEKWRRSAKEIEAYVAKHCMNAEGAYAAFAGSEAVDVSAILFPVWGYIEPEAPEMLATLNVLERDYCRGNLYWRHLEELGRYQEGAFLAGTIWVAQYCIMRKDMERAGKIMEAALAYANDLGFFAEEADPASRQMLGNSPQTFVHAAFIGAVIDYKNALIDSEAGNKSMD
jgi:GH15 family glucan-1,4-alpha-glucosidase